MRIGRTYSGVPKMPQILQSKLAKVHPQEAILTLDPLNWNEFRAQAHRMLDDILDYTKTIRERPVWQPIPAAVRQRFQHALPLGPSALADVHEEFMNHILPFAAGNVHPGFMGWVHGGGTPVGMLAEMLAAGLNANLGGRDQIPIDVERQITRWMQELFRFPENSSGLFVTGTSIANLIAVVVARNRAIGPEVRRQGVNVRADRLTAYGSAGIHSCVSKALDLCGLVVNPPDADERWKYRWAACQRIQLAVQKMFLEKVKAHNEIRTQSASAGNLI